MGIHLTIHPLGWNLERRGKLCEITRIQSGGKPPGRDSKFVDIYHEKPIRLTVRALVPVKEHPKFNFVGKLLGPKGNSMKRLQEDTLTKMAVLGRGSMRNKQQEEDLRNSNDPKYSHLSEDLHVEITAFAPPSEAHARVAYALTEVRKYLIPDSNDEIRQKQMREMELINIQHGSSGDSSEETGSGGEGLSPPPSTRPKSGSQGAPNMLVVRGLMQHSPQQQQQQQQQQPIQQQQQQQQQQHAQQQSQSHNQLQHHNTCKMVVNGQSGRLGQMIRSNGGGGGMNASCNMGNRLNANKVLSILDRIRHGGRGSPDFVQSHHKSGSPSLSDMSGGSQVSAMSPASFVDAINLVEETGLCYEDLGNSEILCGKSLKSSSITRNRLRMQISPYPRPK
ncbi:KH domain-containing, RNA-binding, signal transduction-associated protein 3-like isoform X2 [Tigriopus californicus]|uniref:KH domain-containing, RNA-binding, signal transduction-associated protein 3-like isoform X2 n=1 Tax=Tigriopus californicus TaxID=6832 RepID=UPI0027DA7BE9|nr:KH domain-containing, RNA-binding, signal transduction-associated protein 3-like isoform X2 [Tigriopus californicus]